MNPYLIFVGSLLSHRLSLFIKVDFFTKFFPFLCRILAEADRLEKLKEKEAAKRRRNEELQRQKQEEQLRKIQEREQKRQHNALIKEQVNWSPIF